eukprot:3690379-Rhodomonas_salina.2
MIEQQDGRGMEALDSEYQHGKSASVTDGKRLLLPSELKTGVNRSAVKDWGECMLTFDKIRVPVHAQPLLCSPHAR